MTFEFTFYWKLFLRRLPVMMVFILGCAGLGGVTAVQLPETWSTYARLLVEESQINQVQTFETNAVEQLDIIQQKLLTRATLIDIANRYNVFEDIREMEPDEVVEQMREHTRIRRTAGRNQATLMTISFFGRSGQVVSDVVNEYVTLALDESVEKRVERTRNTLQFFEQEVEELGQDLDRQSAEIAQFKAENADALPEDQSYRLNRQGLLQERLSRLERDQTAAETQRKEVVDIFEATGQIATEGTQTKRTPQQEQLIVVEAELNHLLSIYSERHPRVIRKQAQVAELQAVVAAQAATFAADEAAEEGVETEEAMLKVALVEVDSRLEFISSDIAAVQEELDTLQRAISQSSTNGIFLDKLERRYENIQTQYTAAVNNLNNARMNERIETTAQGQRITVIENAAVPRVPTGPNRIKIGAFGVAVGLALAGAYFVLMEVLNRTVRHPMELQKRFQVTPITIIPYMESRSRRFFRRAGLVTAMLIVLIGVPFALWYVDTNYQPLELLVQKGLNRLGLG